MASLWAYLVLLSTLSLLSWSMFPLPLPFPLLNYLPVTMSVALAYKDGASSPPLPVRRLFHNSTQYTIEGYTIGLREHQHSIAFRLFRSTQPATPISTHAHQPSQTSININSGVQSAPPDTT